MRTWFRASAVIDFDALTYNIEQIRSRIKPDTKLMCVVKANAYGHGAVQIAHKLAAIGVDALAVATVREGEELRNSGITLPILILGYVPKECYRKAIQNDLIMSVYNYAMGMDINAAARTLGKKAEVHIKIDTGMNRIGFMVEEKTIQRIIMLNSLGKNLNISGIFTHFACADCEEDYMTQDQAEGFMWVCDRLKELGMDIPLRHCSNSAAIMRYPQLNYNMVRSGIITYGLYPSEEVDRTLIDLNPVMSLMSQVVLVKSVPAGTPVSYGATYLCDHETKLATISIGYGDGYPRAMSGKGRVLIGSKSYPIVGRICMDQLMVDVTDIDYEIKQGDKVVLIGCQGSERIAAEEIADTLGTINYEIVCNISRRLVRVYMENGSVVKMADYLIDYAHS